MIPPPPFLWWQQQRASPFHPGPTVTSLWVNLSHTDCSGEVVPQPHGAHLTSRSRPAATVTMSPVSLLMVNMFWEGLWGVWVTIR